MKILEGGFPEGNTWRILILLSVGETSGVSWNLAKKLVEAHKGELLLAVLLPDANNGNIEQARQTLNQAKGFFEEARPTYTVIVEAKNKRKSLENVVEQGNIDFLIVRSNNANWPGLDNLSCTVGAIRGEAFDSAENESDAIEIADTERPLKVLLPTSAGPNTLHALNLLMPVTRDATITALYIAQAHLGPSEEALGHSRLQQVLEFADADEKVESKLIVCDSVIDGIVDEAGRDHDLVIIGASQESSLDKALFGDVPAAVVRQSRKPVMVIRQPDSRVGNLVRYLGWGIQNIVPRMNLSERTEAYVRIRRGARPDFDFFTLIGLATAIAALGLLANSAAVVIGAMLVAPLMSPIAGLGLAIVLGDPRFLRLALGAVIRGFILALVVGFLSGLIPLENPMTNEVLARTQPTLLDLGVAIFSGMAVAYALCRLEAAAALPGVAIAAALVPPIASAGIALANERWDEGLGALLLFATNLIAISSAAALIFLILGYRPAPTSKENLKVRHRSVRVALVLLIIVTVVLGGTTIRLAQESATQNQIRELVRDGSVEFLNAEVFDIGIGNLNLPVLDLTVTVRSTRAIPHAAVVELQQFVAIEMEREIAMNLIVIPATELDPFDPPTQTPTATATSTATPGDTPTFTPTSTFTPMPTATNTPSPTPTNTPTATPTFVPTNTPTLTPTPTNTPRTAVVSYPFGLNLRQDPSSDSDLLAFLEVDTVVILLDEQVINEEGTWQQVSAFGLVGWALNDFLIIQ